MSPFSAPDPVDFAATLAVALSASFHCAGMCGGFAVAAGVAGGDPEIQRRLRVIPRTGWLGAQALYHGGKTASYLFLGALATWLGAAVARAGMLPARMLGCLAGLFLGLVGLRALGLLPRRAAKRAEMAAPELGRPGTLWRRSGELARALLSIDSPLRPLYLGVFSGLLPCPIVYAFLARAAAHSSVLDALLTLAALGLGTMPGLLVVAATGRTLSPLLRRRLAVAAGLLMVLLGVWTAYRGWGAPACCPL